MSESATDRVRAALASGQAPARKDWSHWLRESLGMSKARAEKYAAAFVRAGLVVDDPPANPEAFAAARNLLDVVARG